MATAWVGIRGTSRSLTWTRADTRTWSSRTVIRPISRCCGISPATPVSRTGRRAVRARSLSRPRGRTRPRGRSTSRSSCQSTLRLPSSWPTLPGGGGEPAPRPSCVAGPHRVVLARDRSIPPGVYLVRVRQGSETAWWLGPSSFGDLAVLLNASPGRRLPAYSEVVPRRGSLRGPGAERDSTARKQSSSEASGGQSHRLGRAPSLVGAGTQVSQRHRDQVQLSLACRDAGVIDCAIVIRRDLRGLVGYVGVRHCAVRRIAAARRASSRFAFMNPSPNTRSASYWLWARQRSRMPSTVA